MITSESKIYVDTYNESNEEEGIESNCNSLTFINNGTQDAFIYNEISNGMKLVPGNSIGFSCNENTQLTDKWYWYFNLSDGAELVIIKQVNS